MNLIAIALAAAFAQTQPTIPQVSANVDGVQRPMDTISTIEPDGSVQTRTLGPAKTMPMVVIDVPGIQTTAPKLSYEHPLTLQDKRTGRITAYDQIVIHREVEGVAVDPVGLAKPKTPAEAAVGVCTPKKDGAR